MLKKSLLSVAIASSLALVGCSDGGITNGESGLSAYPVFNPVASALPIPNDLIFDKVVTDGTFTVPDTQAPVTTALNELSGASTTAPIDIRIEGYIDGDSLDGRSIVNSAPNPDQNVFLLELNYASGSPLQGLSNGEPPTVVPPAANTYQAEAIELDGKSYIRIHPTKPLKPNTRYVVVLTNEILASDGQRIQQDPIYNNISDSSQALLSSALAPVRDLITKLWETIGSRYFALATNQVRNALGMTPLTADNIALSYSFTTSGDEKVLEYIANPTEWFDDLITTFVRVTAAKSVVTGQLDLDPDGPGPAVPDGKVDYTDVNLAANGAVSAFRLTSGQIAAIEAALGSTGLSGCSTPPEGQTYIRCISDFFAGDNGFADLLPNPKERAVTTVSANQPVSMVSAAVSTLVTNPARPPLVSQGTIAVPYYLGIPAGDTAPQGAVINTQSWKADDVLAKAVNTLLQGLSPTAALAQGEAKVVVNGALTSDVRAPVSTVVNYLFPFPKQSDADTATTGVTDDLTIPWLAVRPHPAQVVQNQGTIIFQHGITTDRSAVLSVGTVLAQAGFTVIGIDQVGHGVSPKSTAARLALAETLLTAGQAGGLPIEDPTDAETKQAVVDGIYTLGFVMAAVPTNNPAVASGIITSVIAGGTSGNAGLDTAIRTLKAFENTVANAGSTIPGIVKTDHERHFDFTASALAQPTPMNFDPDAAFGASGSLYINLTNFTNSRDKNRQGVVDLLNLRQTLAAIDLNNDGMPDLDGTNVDFIGHSLGTATGIPFVTVANSTPVGNIGSASFLEPASGITRMLQNSSNFGPTILGGLAARGVTQGSYAFEGFMNVLQATLDSHDPINFADNLGRSATGSFQTNADVTGTLTIYNVGTADVNGTVVNPSDLANPIEAETTQLTSPFGTASRSYFAGVDKFATQLGAVDVIGAEVDGTSSHIKTRLGFGKHGMFVLPGDPRTGEPSQTSKVLQTVAFGEGMAQTTRFFLDDLEVTNAAGLTAYDGVLIDDEDFESREFKQLNP